MASKMRMLPISVSQNVNWSGRMEQQVVLLPHGFVDSILSSGYCLGADKWIGYLKLPLGVKEHADVAPVHRWVYSCCEMKPSPCSWETA